MRKLYNFVAFQAGWFAAVLGAAHGRAALGIAAVTLVLGIHLWISRDRRGEPKFLLASVAIGFAVDAALSRAGAVVGAGAAAGAWIGPPWMLALWPLFGTLFNESMSWMRGRYAIGVAFAMLGAPLSYLGGARLGALRLHESAGVWITLVALTWGAAMPLLLVLQERWTPRPER